MHIVFFNRSFYPDMAATGQLLTELCEGLSSKYDLQVTVVAGPAYYSQNNKYKKHFPYSKEDHNGVIILRAYSTTLPKEKTVYRFMNYLTYALFSFFAGFGLKKTDIVVAMTDPPIIGLVGLLWARIYGAKFVFWCQDIFPEVAVLLEGFRSGLLNRVLDKVNKFLLQKADMVVAIGDTMKKRLVEIKKVPEDKIIVIHNWVDCEKIYPINGMNPFRSQYGLNGKFVIMHSGNVGLSQDVEKVIMAARQLRDKSDIVFLIVGEGSKKAELEVKAREWGLENVIFLPYQPKEFLKYSFSAADLFVISLKKGLAGYIVPSKLYGILASGRPFIAAVEADCEVASVVRLCSCGVICPPGDSQALVSAILQLYKNPEQLKDMGERARQAAKNYDQKAALNSFYSAFLDLKDI